MNNDSNYDFSVAVIGLSGRFPGAKSVTEFWENLVNAKESISFFSDQELLESGVDRQLIDNPSYVKARGIIGDSAYFDASFFGYSPREAEILDPQHRIFLECAWHAMEDAGYDPHRISAKVGVFGGAGAPWHHLEISKNPKLQALASGMSVIIGNEKDYLTTRVAYKLNLTGSTVSVQCACSTSLAAIVLGMQSLLTHQNDMVLAGGVSINFPEKQGYLYEKGGLDSPDGHCRTFDARAQGTVFSSGAGVVLLKRLPDAIRDGDHIYCILRGGSINNDGVSKVSYTAPSVEGQVAVEVTALEMAGVNPETINYVEAHGTATQIGDPIEVRALTQAFRQYTQKSNFCAIGSVKSNIGHTDAASGVIGLIKIALSMKNQIIPASLNFETPNPQIDFKQSPFYVNVRTRGWEAVGGNPRRAIINSFGVGGTNVCVILEEAPHLSSGPSQKNHFLLLLSARTETALSETFSNMSKYVSDHPEVILADLCYTLQTGRALFEHRKHLVFSNRDELIKALSNPSHPSVFSISSTEKERAVVFMFPGQGNQYVGMGRELYNTQPFFRKQINFCCDILNKIEDYEYDLRKLFKYEDSQESALINQTIIAQPVLFIIEFALAQFLIFLGVHPKAMIGHSIGEFVAACIAEVLHVEDALEIVIARAKLTQKLPIGGMLAIFSGSEQIADFVEHPNEIAVINSPKLVVVSGPIQDLVLLEKKLSQKNIAYKRLNTSHAFHSHMMDSIIEPLKKIISNVKLSSPKIPLMSTVTTSWMRDRDAQDPTYWAEHARKPVRFAEAAQRLIDESDNLYLEVGPGHSLESAIKNCSSATSNKTIGILQSSNRNISEDKFFNIALGKIWACGVSMDFKNLYEGEKRKKVSLPCYPFERKKYLLDFNLNGLKPKNTSSGKNHDIGDWFYLPSWKKTYSLNERFRWDVSSEDDVWIIFTRGDEFGSKLTSQLRSANQKVCTVGASNSYREEGEWDYFIDQAKSEDYFTLFARIKQKSPASSYRIVHLWNLAETSASLQHIAQISENETKSFYSSLFLVQALIKMGILENLHISFVANGIYNLINEQTDPYKSLIIGPCRVFKNEYPKVHSRLLDVEFPQSEEQQGELVKILVSENKYVSDEIVVAYRNLSRWLPTYEPIYLSSENSKQRALRDQGVYVITGGLGAIGLKLAHFIAEKVSAKIILIQRSSFPERSDWNSWLEPGKCDTSIGKKIRDLLSIESKGSSVIIMTGDVTSLPHMQTVFHQIFSRYPTINGVLHCAGTPGGGVIALKSREKTEEVLNPKVRGTLILDKLLKDQDLDFFIICSSITGILGEEGQVDYCAANAFLDGFANTRNTSKKGVYSAINWGAWDDIGMAVQNKSKEELLNNDRAQYETNKSRSKHLQFLASHGNKEHYQLLLDPQNDWFISTHRLKDIPTLVGTAFFEFLSTYCNTKMPNEACVISRARFISPLMFFSADEKPLKLTINEDQGVNTFVFSSQHKSTLDVNERGQEHLLGEITFRKKDPEYETIDLNRLIERMREDFDLEKVHENDSDGMLWTGTRWKTAKRVFVGEGEWLAHLCLPDICQNDVENFRLHPALLDFAGSFSLPYFVDTLYLPYHYEKITVMDPVGPEIFSHVRRKNAEDGYVSLDIDILSKNGKVLVRIEGYTLKKVVKNSQATRVNAPEKASKNILPVEGVEAFGRFFYQLGSPQVIICSEDFNSLIKEYEPSEVKQVSSDKSIFIKHPRPQLFTPYVEPTNEIEKTVASIWETVLGINELGIDDNFIELGGNSLTAIQVVAQLTEAFKVNFNTESFLSNPTIRGISDYIINQLVETLGEEKITEILATAE